MAKITYMKVGGTLLQAEAETVQDLMTKINIGTGYGSYIGTTKVDGMHPLQDGNMVLFSPEVKGGAWENLCENTAKPKPEYPKDVFVSPVLTIIQLNPHEFSVNGMRMGGESLYELYEALEHVDFGGEGTDND